MRKLFTILCVSYLLLASGASSAPGLLPVGNQSFQFLYDRMRHDQAVRHDRFDYQLGPYRLDVISLKGTPFAFLNDSADYQLHLFSSIGENFRAANQSRGSGLEVIRGGLAFRPAPRLFVYGNFALDEARAEDPTYTGKKWRGLAGDVEQAFLFWQTDKFDLTAGRFASFWGPSNSLVLGSDVSLDGFGYSYRWGKVTLSYRLARLDPLKHWKSDSSLTIENRYFAGHRLDFHFSNQLRVGLFETVVFGGEGRQIELYYLNPLIFYHGSQLNEGSNDNTFVGLDFSFKPVQRYHLYGQLLIDDMQIENSSQADQEPNEVGILAGCYIADITPSLDCEIEYQRVANWTFNQNLPRNRYLFQHKLLSGANGNDFDKLSLVLTRWLGNVAAVTLRGSLLRQGEGDVSADWSEPWLDQTGDYQENFPTGVVERTSTLALACKGYFRSFAAFDIEAGLDHVRNAGHHQGDNRSIPFIHLSLTALFSASVNAR